MRHWPLPDTHNVRDLGGYAAGQGGVTQWRRILRADNLHHLDPVSCVTLEATGLGLVLDLRNSGETGAEPNPFARHARYRNISLFGALAPIALAETPFDMAERYRTALDACGDRLAAVLSEIADAPDGLVLFHCTAGKDRTGVVAALILKLAGVADGDVVADYALTAEAAPLLERLRTRALARGGDPAHVERVLASDAVTMRAMLDHLDVAHGGAVTYLDRHGLDAAARRRLVDRLCRP